MQELFKCSNSRIWASFQKCPLLSYHTVTTVSRSSFPVALLPSHQTGSCPFQQEPLFKDSRFFLYLVKQCGVFGLRPSSSLLHPTLAVLKF